MICEYCKKEFESERKTARFCSDKCRLAFNYRKVSVEKPEVSVSEMNASELYEVINNYPEDTWTKSEEYLELMGRLDKMNMKELQKGEYFIPCRKFPHLVS